VSARRTIARDPRRGLSGPGRAGLAGVVGLAVVLSACGPSDTSGHSGDSGDSRPAALFEPMPQPLAAMVCGRPGSPTILEVNGGGAALFDADGDGDMDVLLVIPGAYPARGATTGGSNRLYRNDGGRLVDVTPGSGVDVEGFCNGVAVGDVDADGRRDLYLTRLGENVLLRNAGGLRFERVPDAAGAAGPEDAWSTSAVFVDVDRDGDQDLYVVDYLAFDPDDPPLHGVDGRSCTWLGQPVMCGPQGLPPQADRFYRNTGGRFVEDGAAAGLDAPAAYGLGVIDGDWNADGWPDLYVSNDSMPNRLYLSRGDGTLQEAGLLSGAALSAHGREQAGMGIAAADADGDGDEDLLVTNFSLESNAFYVNLGGGRFSDRADPSGLGGPSRSMLGWGAAFLDADLDGDLDLVTANGHVYAQADAPGTGTRYAQPDTLSLRDERGAWQPAAWPGDEAAVSRALAAGDLDDDGITDLLITRLAGPPAVWRGTAEGRRSLRVTVAGPPGNPDGCGTVLTLTDDEGARTVRVRSSAGYQAASDPRPIFAWRGTGTLSAVLPDGRRIEQPVAAPGALIVEAGTP
jgi:hypothetical protein